MAPPAVAHAVVELAHASTLLHPDDLPQVLADHALVAGAVSFEVYLADLEQRFLNRLGARPGTTDPLSIDGTLAGRAYRTERCVVANADDSAAGALATLWVPLLDSADRLGVVAIGLDAEPDDDERWLWEGFVSLAAEVVANKSKYGDVIVRAQRGGDVSLAAEMRWTTLPPRTYAGRNVTVSAIVEPVHSIAGDSFDYALNGDTLHLAVFDAVGHGLVASRIANVVVGAYRHSRRHDADLTAIYKSIDETIASQFTTEEFATAQLATLDLRTGVLQWLNAGHPQPLVLRNGRRHDLHAEPHLPVGLASSHGRQDPAVESTSLEPGDLLLFFTDGVVEARAPSGEQFGRERLGDLLARSAAAGLPPAETMRTLAHAIVDHQAETLTDDATLLLVVWDGPPGRNA